jgi:carbamoyltransferase
MGQETRADEAVVLGVNLSHDMACAAVVAGEVRFAIAEERLTRIKYCTGLTELGKIIPFRSIHACCEALGVEPGDVDLWVANSCRRSALEQLRSQLLGIPADRVTDLGHPGHHLAHAYSAFYCSSFPEAAVIVLDTNGSFIERTAGGGRVLEKKEHYGIFHGEGDALRPLVIDHVHPGEVSLGELYCIYSAALQLTPRPGPYGHDCPLSAGGKLMGLAAHGEPATPPEGLLRWDGDHLSIELERLVEHLRALGHVARRPLEDLRGVFGFELAGLVDLERRRRSLKHREYLTLAAEAQALLEQGVLEMARRAHEATGSKNVCLAGGNMLNVVACTKILEQTGFTRAFVQPAAGDAGNAIGAALYGYRERLGGRRRPYLAQPYSTLLGRSYRPAEVARAVELAGERTPCCQGGVFFGGDGRFTVRELPGRDDRIAALLPRLIDDEIVALFQGRSEFGPRALGNRSFLASPLRRSMLRRMNRLKGREWYRPLAPVVLEEELGRFFGAPFSSAPFMTFAADCLPITRKRAPAICHVDGTARPQTVTRAEHPLLHGLIRAFAARTDVPILVNTSFNLGGEPIVETPEDAVRSFLRDEAVTALLLEDRLLEKTPR